MIDERIGFHLRRAIHQVRYGLSPVADPFSQSGHYDAALGRSARVLVGIITDTVAPAYAYRVQFGDGHPVCLAYLALPSATGAAGMRTTMTLPAGTRVLCVLPHWPPTAYIIGVLPNFGAGLPDMLFPGTRQRADEAHLVPINMADQSVYDACGGKFFDATTVGEVGWVAETGLRLHLDPFLLTLAVDESCGIFGFYHDQLLRVAGYNFQERTAGREYECLDDQGEYIEYEGSTPYPWEHLGLWKPGEAFRDLEEEEWQKRSPWYGPIEPKDDWQQPWHRIQRYGGYLGQGGKRLVVAPPQEPPEEISKYSAVAAADATEAAEATSNGSEETAPKGLQFPGLFAETIGLDGRYTLESAKGISIVKHSAILVPRRRRRPEQSTPDTGDCPENYRHAGQFGDGPEHEVKTALEATGENASLQRAAGLLDLHAYLFNYAGVHPFHWHAQDWEVPDAAELDHVEHDVTVPDWSLLANQFALSPPDPKKIQVDHRLGEVDYYPTTCGIDFLDDGGVVIYGGCGEEIRMAGGHIWISAPGDIWLQSGRNVNTWAGYDAIIKAKNCIEGSASDKDIRFKAEQHVQILAGNSKENGGILLESRGTASEVDFSRPGSAATYSGILLKSARDIAAISQATYLHTSGGPIFLDAANGSQSLITRTDEVRHFVTNAVRHYFKSSGETTSANVFQATETTLVGTFRNNGSAYINGSLTTDGWINVTNGHVATSMAAAFKGHLGNTSEYTAVQANDIFRDADEATKNQGPKKADEAYTAIVDEWLTPAGLGDETAHQAIAFTFRTPEEYRTAGFALFESRWQQMARLSEKIPARWEEKAVESSIAGSMYPYPGGSSYEDRFVLQDLSLFQFPEGLPKTRGKAGELEEAYRDARYAGPSRVSLQQYPVVIAKDEEAA